jgi:hypothetical protein
MRDVDWSSVWGVGADGVEEELCPMSAVAPSSIAHPVSRVRLVKLNRRKYMRLSSAIY